MICQLIARDGSNHPHAWVSKCGRRVEPALNQKGDRGISMQDAGMSSSHSRVTCGECLA